MKRDCLARKYFLFLIVVLLCIGFVFAASSAYAASNDSSNESILEKFISWVKSLFWAPEVTGFAGNEPGCISPPSGIISWWPGDGDASDAIGSNTGSYNGAYVAGKVDDAFAVGGMVVPDNPSLRPSEFTVAMWVKDAGRGMLVQKAYTRMSDYGFSLSYEPEYGGLYFYWGHSYVGGTKAIPYDGNWHFVVVTFSSPTVKIYVDGVSATYTNYAALAYDDSPLNIGTGDWAFGSPIDEVQMFNRALSDSEIQAEFNAGSAGKCLPSYVCGNEIAEYREECDGNDLRSETCASLGYGPGTLQCTGSCTFDTSACGSAPGCTNPTTKLISWWKGENNANDFFGVNNGVLTGSYITGKVGSAFNGYVTIPDSPTLLRPTYGLTISFWTNNSNTGLGTFVQKGTGAANSGFLLAHEAWGGSNLWFYWNSMNMGAPVPANYYDGNWHFVAVTFEVVLLGSQATAKIYVDGVLQNSVTDVFGRPITYDTSDLRFGSGSYGAGIFPIDEFQIYNRALTNAEILAEYNADMLGKCQTPAVCGDGIILGAEECDDGNTINGDGCSSTCQIEAPACAPIPSGLISWWQGENNANDFNGINNGVLTGSYAAGKVNQSFAVGSYVSIPDSSSLRPANFTIAMWTKAGGLGTMAQKGNGNTGWLLAHEAWGGASLWFYWQSYYVYATVPPTYYDGDWHFVAVTFEQATARIYVDGVYRGGGVDYYNRPVMYDTSPLRFGSGSYGAGSFPIDEFQIFDRVLSDAEIQAEYNAGSTGKCTGGGQICGNDIAEGAEDCDGSDLREETCASLGYLGPGTLQCTPTCEFDTSGCAAALQCTPAPSGMISWWDGDTISGNNVYDIIDSNYGKLVGGAIVPGKVGNAFNFDGNMDYISIPDDNSLDFVSQFTIDAWIYPTLSDYGDIVVKSDASIGTGWFDYLLMFRNSRVLQGFIHNGVNYYNTPTIGPAPLALNNWYHVAMTWDGGAPGGSDGVIKLYVNGNPYATKTGVIGEPKIGTGELNIGKRTSNNNNDHAFTGKIDEVEIFNRVLTQAEIQDIYEADILGKCKAGPVCGDNVIQGGEDCEGTNIRGQTCVSLGFVSGNLACYSQGSANECLFDTTGCQPQTCGNSIIEGIEECDPSTLPFGTTTQCNAFPGKTCSDICKCKIVCGNNAAEGSESCDGNDLKGQTCTSIGFSGGTLSCAGSCTFDTSQCTLDNPPGLVNWWKFEETSGARADDSWDGGDMVWLGTGIFNLNTQGKVGSAVALDRSGGQGSYAISSFSSSLNGLTAFTVEGWVYPTAWGGYNAVNRILTRRGANWIVRTDYYGKPDFVITKGIQYKKTANQALPLNTWTHIAYVYDGAAGKMRIYVNGVLALDAAGPTGVLPDGLQTEGLWISTPTESWRGRLDEMSFYNVALTQSQIQNVYSMSGTGKSLNRDADADFILDSIDTSPAMASVDASDSPGGGFDGKISRSTYGVTEAQSNTLFGINIADDDYGTGGILATGRQNGVVLKSCVGVGALTNLNAGQGIAIKCAASPMKLSAPETNIEDVETRIGAPDAMLNPSISIRLPAGQKVEVDIDSGYPKIMTDVDNTEEVVVNVLQNVETNESSMESPELYSVSISPYSKVNILSESEGYSYVAVTQGSASVNEIMGETANLASGLAVFVDNYGLIVGTQADLDGDGVADADDAQECGNNAVEICSPINPEAGCFMNEQCDDANSYTNDACISCVAAVCGDGYLYTGAEECDDGNTINGDGCSSTCQIEIIDTDNDGVPNELDACPSVYGISQYQGCPVGDLNKVELHIICQGSNKLSCNGAGSMKVPLANAEAKVFEKSKLNGLTITLLDGSTQMLTSNPDGSLYDDIFESGEAISALATQIGCITNSSGACIVGEAAAGEYLVIVKSNDIGAGKTGYTGLPKSASDFVNGLATKDFQFIRVHKKDGSIEFMGGSKTVITGSLLEIVYPFEAIWESGVNNYIYPFIFTSDSDWTVDVCAQVPTGYDVVGVYDENGNLLTTNDCVQTFVSGQTKVIAFEVVETGSPPKWAFNAKIKASRAGKAPKQIDLNIQSTVPAKAQGVPFTGEQPGKGVTGKAIDEAGLVDYLKTNLYVQLATLLIICLIAYLIYRGNRNTDVIRRYCTINMRHIK